jgi:glucose-6-phosphate 1-dehydrogenase
VLVVFGISADLARVMTFRSLFRVECRGLLNCPIVGVAVDDWDVGRLSCVSGGVARIDRSAAGESAAGDERVKASQQPARQWEVFRR